MKQFASVFASLFERETPGYDQGKPPVESWQVADRPWQGNR